MVKTKRFLALLGALLLLLCGCGQAGGSDSDALVDEQPGHTPQAYQDQDTQTSSGSENSYGYQSTGLPSEMPAFTAKDLNGNSVTDAIFAQKELTVINIWGTFCGPCIGEMPELGQWAGEMPDNVQLIGLVTDISGEDDTEHIDLAKEILEKAGADFVNLIPNGDFQEILGWVTGVPTTLFVDSQGNLVGEPIIGADVEGYQSFVEGYLHEH